MTSLLLKHKANLLDFEQWFTSFSHNDAKGDVMRWAKKSRNRIVHESDLELDSSCRVIWIGDWYRRSERVATFPPRMSISELIDAVRSSGGVPPYGVVTVKRRWVDKALPSWELLDATAEAYMKLNNLLRIGHAAAGVEACHLESGDLECVTSELPEVSGHLLCMHEAQSELSGHFSVTDGCILEVVSEEVEIDPVRGADGVRALGLPEFPRGDAVDCVDGFMVIARKVMSRDGFHATFAMCFKGDAVVHIQPMSFDDQRTKMLTFERLANLVESLRADGVLIIGEMWTSEQTVKEKELGTVLLPARDRLDREEALAVYAITRDGKHADLTSPVERTPEGEVVCGEPFSFGSVISNTLIPIQRKWKEMESRGI
ncbi:hypothetical protein OOK43_18970 [[Kitasatospora] papulosa]|uniref:hypothetical protein n=1 Tax=[Kitasatospora] papulosa TaxID=1464011 RepID=UPI002259209A|nr:hypothetical protein [[Kitasatospora] papulosa]MCX4415353.1 hypothetical protein [[Kitasatospora] papulosa]